MSARIENLCPRPYHIAQHGDFEMLTLQPGITTPPAGWLDAFWELRDPSKPGQKHSLVLWFESCLERGDLRVISESDPRPDGIEDPPNLRGYSEGASIVIVQVNNNMATLKRWLQHEGRAAVLTEIKARIKALQATNAPA